VCGRPSGEHKKVSPDGNSKKQAGANQHPKRQRPAPSPDFQPTDSPKNSPKNNPGTNAETRCPIEDTREKRR
jgi:hypothetical protein